jgi:hypothetical protein
MGCACKKYDKKFTGILAEHIAFIFRIEYSVFLLPPVESKMSL